MLDSMPQRPLQCNDGCKTKERSWVELLSGERQAVEPRVSATALRGMRRSVGALPTPPVRAFICNARAAQTGQSPRRSSSASPSPAKAARWGSGSVDAISLAEVGEEVAKARELTRSRRGSSDGPKPAAASGAAKQGDLAETTHARFAAKKRDWKDREGPPRPRFRHWRSTSSPVCGRLDIGLIDYRLLHDALEPLRRLPDTGSLVRARIEAILDFAAVKGALFRRAPNRPPSEPSKWPCPKKTAPSKHFAAPSLDQARRSTSASPPRTPASLRLGMDDPDHDAAARGLGKRAGPRSTASAGFGPSRPPG